MEDFIGGGSEIAITTGRHPRGVFYLLKLGSAELGNGGAHLKSFIIDSTATCVYLRITRAGRPDVLLVGKLPDTSVQFPRKRVVTLDLSVPLFTLANSNPAGTLKLTVRGELKGRRQLTLVPVIHVLLDPPLTPRLPASSRHRYSHIRVTAAAPTNSVVRPSGTYRGSTNYGSDRLVQINTAEEGLVISGFGLMLPSFPCNSSAVEISADTSLQVLNTVAPITPYGAFTVAYTGDEYYTGGQIGGYYVLSMSGTFKPKSRMDFASGAYSVTVYVTRGIGAGATCTNAGTFAATNSRP